jgi:hypothetical protein
LFERLPARSRGSRVPCPDIKGYTQAASACGTCASANGSAARSAGRMIWRGE